MGFIRRGVEGGVFLNMLAFLVGLAALAWLPDEVHIWSSIPIPRMLAILLVPLASLCCCFFLAILTSCDPRLSSQSTTSGAAIAAVIALPGLLAVPLEILVLVGASRGQVGTVPFVLVACLLQLALAGVFLYVEPNYVVGIRDVWTLQSEQVWEETHFFASYASGVAAVVGFVLLFFLPSGMWHVVLVVGMFFFPTALAVLYSYVVREDAQYLDR